MNREIKFRGLARENIEELYEIGWVYGMYVDGHIVSGVVESTEEYIALEYWCRVKEETVGQYTGLKDKNGKKIYDGDIVIYDDYYGRIRWSEDRAMFELDYDDNIVTDFDHIYSKELEVIGNIYENPELIEVKNGFKY